MDKKILFLSFLFIIGFYFLGRGLTGMVVSQSCCFPPECDAENMCEAARDDIKFTTPVLNTFFIIFGVAIAGIGVIQTFKHSSDDFR